MFKKLIIFIFLFISILSCSSKSTKKYNEENEIRSPEEIYLDAMLLFDNKNFVLAEEEFDKLKRLYPLSNESIQAEIMSGFIDYLQIDYESAILKFNKIILKYPSHKNLDYIYYMIAMSNYEQITHHGLDGLTSEIALESFNQVIKRYPKSQYAKDSRQKIILVKSNKAAKHMDIGRFYLKEKKYTAALNRFKIVIEEYSMTKFTAEALHRSVEAYYEMGMTEESIKTAATLGYNYPDSKWYKYSYELIEKSNNEKNLFEKVKKYFN